MDCAEVQRLGESLAPYCDPGIRAVLAELLKAKSPLTARQIAERSGVGAVEEALSRLSGVVRVAGTSYGTVARSTGDTRFYVKLSCPFCGSQDLEREELVEHTGCGYVGRLSDFRTKDGSLRCPRCGSPVDGSSLRSIGFWYECNSCHQTFPRPNISLIGADSGSEVSPEQLEPVKEVSYALSEEAAPAVRELLGLLGRLEGVASSRGYAVSWRFRLTGKSGVLHEFCMGLDGGGSRVLVDLVICGDPPRVLRSVTKAFDASAELPVILLIAPEVEDAALRVLMSAAITGLRARIITSGDPSDLPALLERALADGFPSPSAGREAQGPQAGPSRGRAPGRGELGYKPPPAIGAA
ncbi:MAG: hypothetical protein RXP89_04215 [Nitrososphaeria archaeon]